MKSIDVLYTADHNYVKMMSISLYSLLSANSNLKINVHIVHDQFEPDDFQLVEKIVSQFENATVTFHDFDPIKAKIEKFEIPNWRGTKIANARLFFSDVVKDADQLLYLDSDTFVIGKIHNLKIYDAPINMVRDMMPRKEINKLGYNLQHYYNSGVLWVNMSEWHKNECDKKIADTLNKRVKLVFPDQDALNIALRDDIKPMSPKYNLFSNDSYYSIPFLFMYYKESDIERYSKEEMRDAKDNAIILHATPIAFLKEYTFKDPLHPYYHLYKRYMKLLDPEFIPDERSNLSEKIMMDLGLHLKVVIPKPVRQKIKKIIKK